MLDVRGRPTGEIKPRRAVHRDGDWHRAVNIWIINQNQEVLLQKRASNKDSWPDRWDISCGGHLVAGEDRITAALNELSEELGLTVDPNELIFLHEWQISTRPAPDFINNSFTSLYLLHTECALSDFVSQASEISALKYVTLSELRQMVDAQSPELVPHIHAYHELFRALEA